MGPVRRYFAAVVQAPVESVTTEATARAVQERNAQLVVRWIDGIASMVPTPPRLYVFPALFLTSGRRKDSSMRPDSVAMTLPDTRLDPIIDACARHDCYVASTIQETLPQFPGRTFHTAVILGPQGVVLRSPKAQSYSAPDVTALRDVYDEYRQHFGADSVMPVVETPIGRLGAMLLKETRVPEAARLLVSRGAEVIVHPSGERPTDPPMHQFRQGLAYSMGVYWLTASRSRDLVPEQGVEDWFGAPSAIYGPDGRLQGVVDGPCEGFALAAIDLDYLAQCRQRQAYDTDPATPLYQDLYRT